MVSFLFQVERKRHIGNDIVTIVFQEGDESSSAFKPSMIRSHFTRIFFPSVFCIFTWLQLRYKPPLALLWIAELSHQWGAALCWSHPLCSKGKHRHGGTAGCAAEGIAEEGMGAAVQQGFSLQTSLPTPSVCHLQTLQTVLKEDFPTNLYRSLDFYIPKLTLENFSRTTEEFCSLNTDGLKCFIFDGFKLYKWFCMCHWGFLQTDSPRKFY